MTVALSKFMEGENAKPIGYAYKYDQLNRLLEVNAYDSINMGTNNWYIAAEALPYYHNRFTYDGNGNILSQVRRGGRQGSLGLDSLTYHYQIDNNRLDFVSDGIDDNEYANDIDDQSAGNYEYDALGNLIYDRAEGIDSIAWNLYGKISRIYRSEASGRPNLSFYYSPDGQRIVKRVAGSDTITQLYVRDASGNIMAIYSMSPIRIVKPLDSSYLSVVSRLISNVGLEDYSEFIKEQMRSNSIWRERLLERLPIEMAFSQDSIKECLGNFLITRQTEGCTGCQSEELRDDLFDSGAHGNSCLNYTYLVTSRLMGEKYETWPGTGSWLPINVSFNLAHDAGLESMRVTASSSFSGRLEHPFSVSNLTTMNIDFDINVEPGYDDIGIVITDGGTPVHIVVVNAGTGPYHFSYSFAPLNTNVKLELHTIVSMNQVDYTLDNIRITQDNTGTTSSCIDVAASPAALENLYNALYNCNPEKLLVAFLSQPGFNQDLLLDLESYFVTNFSYFNLLDEMQTYFSELYLGKATASVFLAQTVNKADILNYLNTYHGGYGVSALAQVIESDYVKYLYQVVQSSYEDCEFYHCIGSCASSSNWITPVTALGTCDNTLTTALASIPQDDELINANLYYCYSGDYNDKIHPSLLASFTNSHIVASNPDAFEEGLAAFPYRNLVLMMHQSTGNTSLFSFLMHCNKEKLAETMYRLYPNEFLDIVKNYVSLDAVLGSFSIFVKYDEASTVKQLISPLAFSAHLETNYSGDLTNILNDFAGMYGALLGQITYQAFEECEFKDCVLEHWPGIGVDSSLVYDFIREHHWVNALKNIFFAREDDFNKQFSYLYPVMLAEVLETYTPEERYSMSTFLDGVESYFGYETRKAISMDSTIHDGNLVLNELHLYGSSRLGMMQMQDTLFHYTAMRMYDLGNTHTPLYSTATITQPNLFDSVFVHQRGSKVYEGTNHLGNVLVTFSDKRLTECQEDTIYRYVADVKSQTDYSAFGVLLEERQWYANQDSGGYRFGFNGKENFNKVVGNGNWQDYGERMYSPRLGRFPSPDPIIIHGRQYPMLSSFQFASNSPIQAIDLDGLEGVQYNELYTNWRGKTKIKTVVEIDVHVGINNLNGYTSDNLEFIHKGLIMEYNNGRKHGRKVDGRRVEFRFNMNTFDLNSITAEDKSKELRRIRKVGVSVDSYGNPLKHTNGEEVLKASIVGVVLYINNELPDNLGGKTDRNISGINPNSHNIRHSEAHEIGHFLLWDSPENPISDEAHDKDDGVFYNYTVNGNTNEYITRPKGVSKNNIRSILRNAPRIEHQEE